MPPGFVSVTDQVQLYNYLTDDNGGLYIESVDLGMDHNSTAFFGLLGIKYISDGPDEGVDHLYGQDGTMGEGLNYKYRGGHDAHFRVDELESRGSEALFIDEEGTERIFLVDNGYKTISTSILMGAMMNGDSLNLKAIWISELVDFLAGESSIVAIKENMNDIMMLGGNYPNPFHTQTSIDYRVNETGRVRIDVYNLSGQLLRTLVDKELMPGEYTTTWDGTDLNGVSQQSGFFIYKMSLGGRTKSERMIMLK